MDFIKRHPVPTYFVLTFAISWVGFLAVVGPGVFTDTSWQTDPRFPLAVLAMLAGPAVTGLLLTGLLDGSMGLREMGSRLVRWRVDVRWYVMALVPAPVLAAAGLLALSITSPIFIADNKVVVLILGISAVPMTVLEEVGWTGFAVPRLRLRYSALTTGLIVGVLWGAWHLLQQLAISGTYAGTVSQAVYLPLAVLGAVAQLTAYRVLMVWVYDRTGQSLLVTTLMHGSLTASEIFIFTPIATGVLFLTYTWLLAAALWAAVGIVAVTSRGQLTRTPPNQSVAV